MSDIAQREPGLRGFSPQNLTQQRWQVREVARQIDNGLFERAVLNPPKLSTALREMQPQANQHFKDAYLLEFLALPDLHSEADLHRSLLLCASKDSEVVEYALSRTLSPALVAQYQTQLPDKNLLAAKLHEFYALSAPEEGTDKPTRRKKKGGRR